MTYPMDEMRTNSAEINTRFEGNFAQGAAQGAGTFIYPSGITAGNSTHTLTHTHTHTLTHTHMTFDNRMCQESGMLETTCRIDIVRSSRRGKENFVLNFVLKRTPGYRRNSPCSKTALKSVPPQGVCTGKTLFQGACHPKRSAQDPDAPQVLRRGANLVRVGLDTRSFFPWVAGHPCPTLRTLFRYPVPSKEKWHIPESDDLGPPVVPGGQRVRFGIPKPSLPRRRHVPRGALSLRSSWVFGTF